MTTISLETIDVVLVAHHTLVGEAVATALSGRGVRVTPQPVTGGRQELARLARRASARGTSVGLVVRDLGDPVQLCDTVRLIEEVPLDWVVLTSCRDESRWGAAVEAGAAGVMTMSSAIADVDDALRAVGAGRPGMPEDRRAEVLAAWQELEARHRHVVMRMGDLSSRELMVLGLLAAGLSVARIAERLGLTENNVRGNVRALTGRLGVRSQLAAVAAYHQVVRACDRLAADAVAPTLG